MDTTDARFPVETLWVDSVNVSPVDADWDALRGEDGEGFVAYEAPECLKCDAYALYGRQPLADCIEEAEGVLGRASRCFDGDYEDLEVRS